MGVCRQVDEAASSLAYQLGRYVGVAGMHAYASEVCRHDAMSLALVKERITKRTHDSSSSTLEHEG